MKKVFLVSLLLFVAACTRSERYTQVVAETLPKTVSIYSAHTSSKTVAGAGVFVSSSGHILTCAHLFIKNNGPIVIVTNDGIAMSAELLAIDARKDLALLKAETQAKTPFIKIADPRTLLVGQEVLAFGNLLGFSGTVTHGIISALNRDTSFRYNLVQTDASINMGNSGGPLVGMNGALVGINVMLVNPSNLPTWCGLGFATSSGQAYEFLVRTMKKYKGLTL